MSSGHHLVCRRCTSIQPAGSVDYRCRVCQGELVVEYDVVDPATFAGTGMWRYRSLLPLDDGDRPISLGEGATALVALDEQSHAELGAGSAHIKCEHLNPTGSFKDRIASVGLSVVGARGLVGVVGTSSGNGGAAAAAYSARAGVTTILFTLADTAPEKLLQIQSLGAEVYLVEGIGHDAAATEAAAAAISQLAAERRMLPLLTGGRFSPEAMEGATTIAYEIAEELPDTTVVYVPVGGGGLLAAIWRGYSRLVSAGRAAPRIVAVQPVGCATMRAVLRDGTDRIDTGVTTSVSGLQVAMLFDRYGAADAVVRSGGHLTEVDDDDIWRAQALLARRNGLLVEPAGATAFAGALADAAAGRLAESDRVVILATGAGYKDGQALRRLAGPSNPVHIRPDEIAKAMDDASR